MHPSQSQSLVNKKGLYFSKTKSKAIDKEQKYIISISLCRKREKNKLVQLQKSKTITNGHHTRDIFIYLLFGSYSAATASQPSRGGLVLRKVADCDSTSGMGVIRHHMWSDCRRRDRSRLLLQLESIHQLLYSFLSSYKPYAFTPGPNLLFLPSPSILEPNL